MRYTVLHPDDPSRTHIASMPGGMKVSRAAMPDPYVVSNHTDCRSISEAVRVALTKQGEVRIRVELDEQAAFVYLVVEREDQPDLALQRIDRATPTP